MIEVTIAHTFPFIKGRAGVELGNIGELPTLPLPFTS